MGTLNRRVLEGQQLLSSGISVDGVFRRSGGLFRVARIRFSAKIGEFLEEGVVVLEGDNHSGSLAGSVSEKQDWVVHCVTYVKV